MANFEPICNWVLRIEDSKLEGIVVDLHDGEGRTRFGIGEHSHPTLPEDFYTCDAGTALIIARHIYELEYWHEFWGDQIISDNVASVLMNMAVNLGTVRTIRLLQAAVNEQIDGLMGPNTLAATNQQRPDAFANIMRNVQATFYKTHSQAQYLSSLLRRAALVYPSLV